MASGKVRFKLIESSGQFAPLRTLLWNAVSVGDFLGSIDIAVAGGKDLNSGMRVQLLRIGID